MQRYKRKKRGIDMTPSELYERERARQRKRIEKNVSEFGRKIKDGEYKDRIVFILASAAVLIIFSAAPLYLSGLVESEKSKRKDLTAELSEQKRIYQYERNIVIPSEPFGKAQEAAEKIAKIQNKYIIDVLEDTETSDDIDRELEHANYLRDSDCTSWINLSDRENLRNIFAKGDFYWVGYADNTLNPHPADTVAVFFVLYDADYPLQIIEYRYEVKNNVLIYGKVWG